MAQQAFGCFRDYSHSTENRLLCRYRVGHLDSHGHNWHLVRVIVNHMKKYNIPVNLQLCCMDTVKLMFCCMWL